MNSSMKLLEPVWRVIYRFVVSYLAYATGIHAVNSSGSQLYYKERFLAIVYCSPVIYTISIINFFGTCNCEHVCNIYVAGVCCAIAVALAHFTSEDSKLIRDVYERRKKEFSLMEEILFFIVFDLMLFTLAFSCVYLIQVRGL